MHLFAIFDSKELKVPIEVEITNLIAEGVTYFDSCYLPAEVLKQEGKFTIGIYGYILNEDESLKKRLSLNPIECKVVKGSYEEITDGAEVPDPSVFEIYFNKIAEYEERIDALFSNANESLKKIKHFNSVADMKADTTLEATYYVKTLGYYEANDGGGADYLIREATAEDIDDGGSIHFISNGLVAELISDKPFVIKPELLSGTTDQEILQKAVDLACSINNSDIPVTIELNRIFNIETAISVNKETNRVKITFNGINGGGIKKVTSGEMFIKTNSYVSDIDFSNVRFSSQNSSGVIIMKSPDFINIYFNNCTFTNIDTAIYSETYLQSISFRNCLVTGGSGHFINTLGAYYLNIDNSIIEHRTAGFLINQRDEENTYNRLFFVTVTNNLIEGFSQTEGGFTNICRINEFSVCNNYFEGLYRVIELNAINTAGQLNIENNRFFANSNYPQETGGFVYMNTDSTGIFKAPTISFKGNRVENTYAFFFNKEEFDYNTGSKINYDNNSIINTFTGTYSYKDIDTNLPFNILPMIKTTEAGAKSKYQRHVTVITSDRYNWQETLTIDEITYDIYFINDKYNFRVEARTTISKITKDYLITPFYFGVDIYFDDIVSVTAINPYVNVLNACRYGNTNSKYINLTTKAITEQDQANVMTNISVILCGVRG